MGFMSRLRPDQSTGQPEIARNPNIVVNEKNSHDPAIVGDDHTTNVKSVAAEDSDNDNELVHTDMQNGIQKIEGMAQVWPKWALYFTYAW